MLVFRIAEAPKPPPLVLFWLVNGPKATKFVRAKILIRKKRGNPKTQGFKKRAEYCFESTALEKRTH